MHTIKHEKHILSSIVSVHVYDIHFIVEFLSICIIVKQRKNKCALLFIVI